LQALRTILTETIDNNLVGTDFVMSVAGEAGTDAFEISVADTVLIRVEEDEEGAKEAVVSWAYQDEHVGSTMLKIVQDCNGGRQ
jgi:hypothetical protein